MDVRGDLGVCLVEGLHVGRRPKAGDVDSRRVLGLWAVLFLLCLCGCCRRIAFPICDCAGESQDSPAWMCMSLERMSAQGL